MASADLASARFRQEGDVKKTEIVQIEWEKHTGIKVQVLFKYDSDKSGYYHQSYQSSNSRTVAGCLRTFNRLVLERQNKGFVNASFGLKEGHLKPERTCFNEKCVRIEKAGDKFALSLVELIKDDLITAPKDEKVLSKEVFDDLKGALLKAGRIVRKDEKIAEQEHQEYIAYLKAKGYMKS